MTEELTPHKSGSPGKRRALLVGSLVASLALVVAVPLLYWKVCNSVPRVAEMFPPAPRPNGHDAALRVLHRFQLHDNLPFLNDLPDDPDEIRPSRLAVVAQHLEPRLTELRTTFRLPWRVLTGEPRSEDLSDTGLSALATLFVVEGRAAAAKGDRTKALSCCIDALELGKLACTGGSVTYRYDGQSCKSIGLDEIERLYPQVSSAGLEQQIVRVRQIRMTWPTIAEALDAERILSLHGCHQSLVNAAALSPMEQLSAIEGSPSASGLAGSNAPVNWDAWRQLLTPKSFALAEINTYYHRLSEASMKPAPQGVPVPPISNRWAEPYCNSSFTGRYRGEWPRNDLALLEVALAVRHHFLQTGCHPKSLKEVSSKVLPELPLDVWGQPVAYRLRSGKPVVYSLGCDGVDDGGRAVNPSTLINGGKGDVVFGRLSSSWWQRRTPPGR